MTAIAQAIRQHDSCLLLTHVNPDGDALGSMLGLALGLEQLGMRAFPVCPEPVPAVYRFLPGADRISEVLPAPPPPLVITVDADGRSRVGAPGNGFDCIPAVIDIDHHATGQAFGQLPWIDAKAAAAGEMVYRLLKRLGVTLTPDIATCLYTAIITDTGRFCYSNTSPRALRSAAALVRAGAHPARIYREVYENKAFSATKLLGLALARMERVADGRVVFTALTSDDFASAGSSPDETEGINDQLRAVRGALATAVFTELPDGSVKVSMRSQGAVDVSAVALRFGGGGHRNAAGCTLPGPPEPAQARVVEALIAAVA